MSRIVKLLPLLLMWAGPSFIANGQPIPKGFFLGTAIAGFQVEMGCPSLSPTICEDRASDWYEFITSPWTKNDPSLFMKGDPAGYGPGFYETYREDLARARKELGSNAIRLSLEWSRLFPNPTYDIETFEDMRLAAAPAALAYYHDLLAAVRKQGMVPFVTLNHYTLPKWIHSGVACHFNFLACTKKGWADPAHIIPEITKFARFAAQEFGGDVDDWLTLNEPFSAVVLPSYLLPMPERTNPPGVYFQVEAAKKANAAMIEAHARMYDAIHEADLVAARPGVPPAQVGIAYSFFAIKSASQNPIDKRIAGNLRYILHEQFLDAVTFGRFDRDWNGRTIMRLDLVNRLDFIGVNYYVRMTPPSVPNPNWKKISKLLTVNPVDAIFDRDAPDGLTQVLIEQSRYGLPLYVTETGTDAINDSERPRRWLLGTLAATRDAINAGIDVRGYFYWSLMDNYEWNHGFDSRFGLYEISPHDPDKARLPRSAVNAFRQVSDSWTWPE